MSELIKAVDCKKTGKASKSALDLIYKFITHKNFFNLEVSSTSLKEKSWILLFGDLLLYLALH